MTFRESVRLLAGFALGALIGVLGITVTHLNELYFGAMYSRYQWDWLAIPSLPGEIIAEWRQGYDWQFGEWWPRRYEIVGWNALLWGVAWLAAVIVWKLGTQLARIAPR